MKLLELPFIETLKANLKNPKGLLQVVLGPRQVGKTTTLDKFLIEKLKNKSIYHSADAIFNSNEDWLMEIWTDAIQNKKILIIDEIQKCENWSEVLKKLWDKKVKDKKEFYCILLGSSSLEIQKGLNESLTGRFQLINVFHWNFEESKKGYSLKFEDYLKIGGYPGSYEIFQKSGLKDWVNYVKNSIVSTVVEKDILLNSRVKSPALFKQAFEILISYPCHEISYTKILGQLQDKGNVDLIKYYINLYEGAFLIKSLQKFSANTIRLKASSPKIITLAPCLYFLNIQDDYTDEEKGYAFEALVGSQLLRMGDDLYYWREGDYEVDFVLKRGRKIWAIEVKSGKTKKAKSLNQFLKKFPSAKAVIITLENYFDFEKDPFSFFN